MDGIFYSVGIIKDSYMVNKLVDDLYDVLVFKVKGFVYLDEVIKDLLLDFFIFFLLFFGSLGSIG